MPNLSIDIETYSDVDLKKCGLYKYASSPAFEILLIAYSIDGAPPITVDLTQSILDLHNLNSFRRMLDDPAYVKSAYNAAFEWYCLSRFCNTILPIEQWCCTQLSAVYCGYPFALGDTTAALRLPQDKQKDKQGKALIKYFCTPCAPTKTNGHRARNLPEHAPERWELFRAYNAQDVIAEMAVAEKLRGFSVPEDLRRQWQQNCLMNARGIHVDSKLVAGARKIADAEKDNTLEDIRVITGVANPNSDNQIKAWMSSKLGYDVTSIGKDAITGLRKTCNDPDVLAYLDLREDAGKSSLAKYDALAEGVCDDGTIKGAMRFYGAYRTGRWSGQLVQPQNLPRTYLKALDLAREWVTLGKAEHLRMAYGSVASALSQLIRTALIPPPGCVFVDVDFSAIEARVIAWLAGEEWALNVFRGHGKIYEACASQMFGVPLDQIDGRLRQKGKVATLALGYQGGTGSLIAMGALNGGLSENDLPDIVERWRKANPNIVRFWYAVEAAALAAVQKGERTTIGYITIAREYDAAHGVDLMTVLLPSGRKLCYPEPCETINRFGRPAVGFKSLQGIKWAIEETYGGKLVENITQAVARDCLAEALDRIEGAGYEIPFHVHDEVVASVAEHLGDAALAHISGLVSQSIAWAPGLPMAAAGWVGKYYRKD